MTQPAVFPVPPFPYWEYFSTQAATAAIIKRIQSLCAAQIVLDMAWIPGFNFGSTDAGATGIWLIQGTLANGATFQENLGNLLTRQNGQPQPMVDVGKDGKLGGANLNYKTGGGYAWFYWSDDPVLEQ